MSHTYYQLKHIYEDYKTQEYGERRALFSLLRLAQCTEARVVEEHFEAIKPPHLSEGDVEEQEIPDLFMRQ